jgi:nitric oxide reductase subunit C
MKGTRLFFVGCLLIGAALTIILLPGALRPRAMSSEARAGWAIWQQTGCEGCHTLYGQGGSYAPDLTHIYESRGAGYLTEFLANPAAFHPGQRAMPAFGLTKSQTDNLITFLQWIGTQDTAQSWPPRPILVSGSGAILASSTGGEAVNAADIPADPLARGEYWFKRPPANCITCHSLEPDVVIVGPSLTGIASRAGTRVEGMDAQTYIRDSILNPGDHVVEGFPDAMARNLGDVLSADQLNDIIGFLMTLE